MKLRLLFLGAGLMFQGVVSSASAQVATVQVGAARPVGSVGDILGKLKGECDNPNISNESRWISYCSDTELKRRSFIAALKAIGEEAESQVRREMATARGEYREMLVVALAAFGDNSSIWQAGQLMLKARNVAVRVCAAMELRELKDKRLVEPFKQALADQFERMDGSCVGQRMIFPVRMIAGTGLVGLGFSLEDVRQLERQHLIAKIRAGLEKRTDVEANWKGLVSELKEGRPVFGYNGRQVLLRGRAMLQGNPIRVKVGDAGVVGVVMLQEKHAKALASYGEGERTIEVRGVVRSTNTHTKEIEVWSMESRVIEGD